MAKTASTSLICRALMPLLGSVLLLGSCNPPPPDYPSTKLVTERRNTLTDDLIALLPADEQSIPEARAEARWLADTAYKASAGIARVNDLYLPGWMGNILVNWGVKERGLCWHYQHDLFRELRRRPLQYFKLGCCVRDRSEGSEHNCVYIAAKGSFWPDAVMLDAWRKNGRLTVDHANTLDLTRWKDLPETTELLTWAYPEGHKVPTESWLSVRIKYQKYMYNFDPRVVSAPQYLRMIENIRRGQIEHPGKPTNY